MKKLTITLLLLLPLIAAAQEFRVGTYQGLNNSTISDDQLFLNKVRRKGYIGGFHMSLTQKKIEYGIGISYTQRGFAFLISTYDDTTHKVKSVKNVFYQYNYLALPLSVNYRGNKRFFGQFGVSLIPAWLVEHRVYLEEERLESENNSGPTKFDMGAQLNLGCGLKLNDKWSILTRLAFYRSFTRVNNDNYYSGTDFRNKATSLGFSIEYRFKG